MTWTPERQKHDWRKFLTEDEAKVIGAADRDRAEITKLQAAWRKRYGLMRTLIVNRAIQRAKYAVQP